MLGHNAAVNGDCLHEVLLLALRVNLEPQPLDHALERAEREVSELPERTPLLLRVTLLVDCGGKVVVAVAVIVAWHPDGSGRGERRPLLGLATRLATHIRVCVWRGCADS